MMSPHNLSLLLAITLLGACQCQTNCSYNKLVNSLNFSSSFSRPVINWKTVTNVTIGMILYSVVSLDTSLQTLTTLIWFSMEWKHEFINWDPESYCSIKSMLVTGNNLWKPDLYIYEMTSDTNLPPFIAYYRLDYTGVITSSLPMKIVSSCRQDIFKFPFDTQTCTLTFGSYNYPVEEITMISRFKSMQVFDNTQEFFVTKGDWVLLDMEVINDYMSLSGVRYSTVRFEITLKRAAALYIVTLIIPASFLAVLDVASMFMNTDSGERLGFKITIVLGFSVLLLILNNLLPTSNITPALGIVCCICLFLMLGSIFGSVLVTYMLILSANQADVPPWIRVWITGYLARGLCFKEKIISMYSVNKLETYVNKRAFDADYKKQNKTTQDSGKRLEVKLLKRLLRQILKIHEELVNSRNKEDLKTEWYAAALVVDRLFFLLYLITIISLFVAILVIWVS